MDQATLKECQDAIGYHFTDPSLLWQALTHASVAPSRAASNERLEFLGDSVLSLVVCESLYKRDDKLLEGDMTKIKSVVVSGQTCAVIAEQLSLPKLLSLGKGLAAPSGPPASVTADLLEAIIGAIFLDGGLAPARQFICSVVEPHIQQAMADKHQQNFKSVLQQYIQRRWNSTPDYILLDEKGPDHSKCFEVAVSVNGAQFPSKWGRTKKEAEQAAARGALLQMGQLAEEEAEADENEEETSENGH